MSQPIPRKPKLPDLQKLLRSLPKVTLDPNHHEVSPIPNAVKISFIDAKYMRLFEPFAELNARTLKLVNYNKAAINLTFFEKHKYKVNKEPEPEDITNQLEKKLEELKSNYGQVELFTDAYTITARGQQQQQIVEIQQVLNEFHNYRFAVSNYFRNYTYWYITWRWENPDSTLGHGNDHLLKNETDYNNNVTILKQNVIFVDMKRISDHTPYQSKKVEKFLSSFEKRIEIGTIDVFVGAKNSPDFE
jgi:hypothetical protein